MDTSQHRSGGDDYVFADAGFESPPDRDAVVDFSDDIASDGAQSASIGEFIDDEPSRTDEGTAPEAVLEDAGVADAVADDDDQLSATVTNPPETVSVTAGIDGAVDKVALYAGAARMTEVDLAEEICVIADLARQQALSIQRELVTASLNKMGVDDNESIADMLQNGPAEMPSSEQAAEARASVFATRYVNDGRWVDSARPGPDIVRTRMNPDMDPQVADLFRTTQQIQSAMDDHVHKLTTETYTGTDEANTVRAVVDGRQWLTALHIQEGLLRKDVPAVAQLVNEAINNARATAMAAGEAERERLIESLANFSGPLTDMLEENRSSGNGLETSAAQHQS